MGLTRTTRKEKQALHEDPINFCCGKCRLSQKFYKETPYVCSECKYCEVLNDSGNVVAPSG